LLELVSDGTFAQIFSWDVFEMTLLADGELKEVVKTLLLLDALGLCKLVILVGSSEGLLLRRLNDIDVISLLFEDPKVELEKSDPSSEIFHIENGTIL
jgi:hypothetical protein